MPTYFLSYYRETKDKFESVKHFRLYRKIILGKKYMFLKIMKHIHKLAAMKGRGVTGHNCLLLRFSREIKVSKH